MTAVPELTPCSAETVAAGPTAACGVKSMLMGCVADDFAVPVRRWTRRTCFDFR